MLIFAEINNAFGRFLAYKIDPSHCVGDTMKKVIDYLKNKETPEGIFGSSIRCCVSSSALDVVEFNFSNKKIHNLHYNEETVKFLHSTRVKSCK